MPAASSFTDESLSPAVRGFLHAPEGSAGDALVLSHGAGSNCNAPLLIAMAGAFAARGTQVLLIDLPFRQARPTGPPFPGQAERDRSGIRNAVAAMRKLVSGSVFLGGHSYGGRQSSMLCAAEPDLTEGLLLLSYPLHPPRKPEQLRIQHLPNLRTPGLFVHGTRDPFGSIEEMKEALQLIPACRELLAIDGAGHDLGFKGKKSREDLPACVLAAWERMFSLP